ncbi:TPA: SGNH/GDSL hydrolase family protein [Burkholderia stabilis]|nr:SGNH/GDSL hydrolase family protein [Burkholderia stabilis]HDR9652991.1 SGNH/GDSL hydrolase family protein [Burkholderia stabilis]HDR9659688.1 SGNH/GDSL hydrolase family protein [Burkholderia stabilis]HDR9683387.1 SGNH/GDSL hydrolase family protein [Burkholderia stabilis]
MHHSRLESARRLAATATLGAALAFTASLAPAAAAPLPTPTGDMTLSPSGPLAAPASAPPGASPRATSRAATRAASRGSDTYTYLRCWYRISDDPRKPEATYEWARDPAGGDWYRVPGYWWADGVTQWKNMFYSTTAQDTLADVCRRTLDARGIRAPLTQAVAANNALSFNYTVWTIDSAQQDARVNKLIVFGDSLSDTQNMFNASQWKLPNGTSWHAGRFSNGPVWAEYVANTLRLPLYNWAIGGAATDQYLVVPGLVQQIDSWREYMGRAPDYRPANTLFAVFAGGNDLVNYGRTPEQAANAVRNGLERLAAAGATRILLVTLPDVSRAPVFATRTDTASVAAQVTDYNRRLVDAAAAVRARYGATLRLEVFDAYAPFADLLSHPAQYDFDDAKRSCLDIPKPSSLTYLTAQTPRADCRDPARFVFWDTLHPTTRTHAWLAERITPFVRARLLD